MAKLFRKKAEGLKRVKLIQIRVTEQEHAEMSAQAGMRALDISEYLRRVALHRRAEVKIEQEMILEVSSAVRALREIHAGYLAVGQIPPVSVLQPLLDRCETAILSLSNY